MRRILSIIISALALLAPASSFGATPLQTAMQRAEAFWKGPPSCGYPTVRLGEALGDGILGGTYYTSCLIELPARDWTTERQIAAKWPELCRVLTHEYGHLELGPSYFAAVNPADPAHSPSERNIMFYSSGTWTFPSTCFPMTFKFADGSALRWQMRTHTLELWTRGRRRGWLEAESNSGPSIFMERPSEARSVSAAR